MSIINHVETYLGEIDSAWKPDSTFYGISVSRFLNQPADSMSTYVTFGLSHHKLLLTGNKEVCQELMLTTLNNIPGDEIASFLLRISDLVLSKHEGLLRGQVIGPGKPLFSGSSMNAVYASIPVIFDEGLATFKGSSPATVMVWLIPIYSNEAIYIDQHGWESFEDALESKDPDLWDVERKSVVTGKL